MADKKRLAIYVKKFRNESEQQYIYGDKLDEFLKRVRESSDWEKVETYTDELHIDNQSGELKAFQQMINRALKGKIDYIATYSISLFGESRDATLEYINALLEKGIGVLFYHEQINILDEDGRDFIRFFNRITQNEAVLYSVKTKRRVKKLFQKGKAHAPTTYFLGYETDEYGNMVINEEEAEIVKRIFNDFLSGKGTPTIAKELSKEKIKTARGNTNWTSNAVYKIIKQEKYYGAVRTQKTITVDLYTHKRVINRENEPQYLIKNNHPAIISEDTFFKAQRELERRSMKRGNNKDKYVSTHSNVSPYSNHLTCGECGRPAIRRKLTSSRNGQKYHFAAWQCRVAAGKDSSFKDCNCQYVWEEEFEKSFLNVLVDLKANKESIITEVNEKLEHTSFTDSEQKRLNELTKILENIESRIHEIADLTAIGNDAAYEESLEQLTSEREQLYKEYEALKAKKYGIETKDKQLDILLDTLDQLNPETDDVKDIFSTVVEKGVIFNNRQIEIHFKCGIVRKMSAHRSK